MFYLKSISREICRYWLWRRNTVGFHFKKDWQKINYFSHRVLCHFSIISDRNHLCNWSSDKTSNVLTYCYLKSSIIGMQKALMLTACICFLETRSTSSRLLLCILKFEDLCFYTAVILCKWSGKFRSFIKTAWLWRVSNFRRRRTL